ncbi:hypothetical protein DPMN_113209 [Dreissena polymorpha]|uniref:Ig-like domain-containing protein n=1 Tax=Dreissena polymorpha TaxID=45954 RepID=A0A9D4KID5_DREPO|nr:hypothetical protein DPMN_113209 [Dreissena polymorpha]
MFCQLLSESLYMEKVLSNTSVLSLGSVYRDEAGPYACTATNPGSQMLSSSETIMVEVIYDPAVVNLTPSNLHYTLTEGQTLRNISWYAEMYVQLEKNVNVNIC